MIKKILDIGALVDPSVHVFLGYCEYALPGPCASGDKTQVGE
jgi:hypothetical protein